MAKKKIPKSADMPINVKRLRVLGKESLVNHKDTLTEIRQSRSIFRAMDSLTLSLRNGLVPKRISETAIKRNLKTSR
jgi:hypothetical protein